MGAQKVSGIGAVDVMGAWGVSGIGDVDVMDAQGVSGIAAVDVMGACGVSGIGSVDCFIKHKTSRATVARIRGRFITNSNYLGNFILSRVMFVKLYALCEEQVVRNACKFEYA